MRIIPHEKFEGVFWLIDEEHRLATLNSAPGTSIYGERLVEFEGAEYRAWDPFRSKLAAVILKGASQVPIKPGLRVLYLGSSTGTTASHVGDIVGEKGIVYCVDFAPRVMREFLINACPYRKNLIPILSDARYPESYRMIVGEVDCIYMDLAQPNQAYILVRNADIYLKEGGWFMLAIKARSIDFAKEPSKVFKSEMDYLKSKGFRIEEAIHLRPFDEAHMMLIGRRPDHRNIKV